MGGLAYAITALRLLKTYETHQVTLLVNGKEHTFSNVWLTAINNIPYYGGGMKISPKAKPNDGKLRVCIVHNISRKKLLTFFGTVFFGKHTALKGVTFLEGTSIEVASQKAMTIQADGEVIGVTPISIRIEARSRPIC
jgi:diacylglycerol kinase (ATP)